MWIGAPIAETLIGLHNYYGGSDPYRYGLFFMVVYAWVGVSQRRWSTLPLLPITLLAYELPLVLSHRPAWAMWSALYAVPVFMLVGETISWLASQLRSQAATLAFQTLHDPLTGLANRSGLENRIATEVCGRQDTQLGVLFLDVDQFKNINDTLGHESGDAVLREVARRLLNSVRTSDTVARVGGDEFVVIIEDEDEQVMHYVAERIDAALNSLFDIGGDPVPIVVSMGIAVGAAATRWTYFGEVTKACTPSSGSEQPPSRATDDRSLVARAVGRGGRKVVKHNPSAGISWRSTTHCRL